MHLFSLDEWLGGRLSGGASGMLGGSHCGRGDLALGLFNVIRNKNGMISLNRIKTFFL